jgi:hypothetical protein
MDVLRQSKQASERRYDLFGHGQGLAQGQLLVSRVIVGSVMCNQDNSSTRLNPSQGLKP